MFSGLLWGMLWLHGVLFLNYLWMIANIKYIYLFVFWYTFFRTWISFRSDFRQKLFIKMLLPLPTYIRPGRDSKAENRGQDGSFQGGKGLDHHSATQKPISKSPIVWGSIHVKNQTEARTGQFSTNWTTWTWAPIDLH